MKTTQVTVLGHQKFTTDKCLLKTKPSVYHVYTQYTYEQRPYLGIHYHRHTQQTVFYVSVYTFRLPFSTGSGTVLREEASLLTTGVVCLDLAVTVDLWGVGLLCVVDVVDIEVMEGVRSEDDLLLDSDEVVVDGVHVEGFL